MDGVAAVSADGVVELLEAVPLDEVSVAVADDELDPAVSELLGVEVPDAVVLLEEDELPEAEGSVVAVPLEDEASELVEGAGEGV